MFDDNAPANFVVSDWDFSNNRGPRHTVFQSEELGSGPTRVIENVEFQDCDFQGLFERKIVFKLCKFIRCDFGLSTFIRTKFSGCHFADSSFTQCTLENCDLRNCTYNRIFFSGNETQIPRTLIAEPHQFLFEAQAPIKNIPPQKSAFEQQVRFEETRSTIARALLANLQSEGSEDNYYTAVRASTIAESRAKIARSFLAIRTAFSKDKTTSYAGQAWEFAAGVVSAVSAFVGIAILFILGSLNGWGSSISRAFLFGSLAILGLAYCQSYRFNIPFGEAIIKTIEVFFLFGYTNHAKTGAADFNLVFSSALIGLLWYAITIPTIANRLTRARG